MVILRRASLSALDLAERMQLILNAAEPIEHRKQHATLGYVLHVTHTIVISAHVDLDPRLLRIASIRILGAPRAP